MKNKKTATTIKINFFDVYFDYLKADEKLKTTHQNSYDLFVSIFEKKIGFKPGAGRGRSYGLTNSDLLLGKCCLADSFLLFYVRTVYAKTESAYTLNTYIRRHYNSDNSLFAESQGVSKQEVNRWVRRGYFVVNDEILSFRRLLKSV